MRLRFLSTRGGDLIWQRKRITNIVRFRNWRCAVASALLLLLRIRNVYQIHQLHELVLLASSGSGAAPCMEPRLRVSSIQKTYSNFCNLLKDQFQTRDFIEKTIGELELDPPVTYVCTLNGKSERSVDSHRQSALTAARSRQRFTNKSTGERIYKHKCDTHCVIVAVPNIHCSNNISRSCGGDAQLYRT